MFEWRVECAAVWTVLWMGSIAAATGCTFEADFGGAECDGEEARRDGRVCRNGYWVLASGGDAGPHGVADTAPADGRGAEPDTSEKRPDTCRGGESCGGPDDVCDGGCCASEGLRERCSTPRDDDCDGVKNEGCSCHYRGRPRGVCADQRRGPDGNCPTPAHWEPETAAESACDGLDNDCDGSVDEGCDCRNGAMRDCYTGPAATEGVGRCVLGTQTCRDGTWSACNGDTTPRGERCANGTDDDCDGAVDGADDDCGDRPPGASCSGDARCGGGQCVDGTCAQRIFVTSSTFGGDLGGVTGANSKCASAAEAAGLGGAWRAVVSVPGQSAESRLSVVAPVVNVQGGRLADGAGSLWTGGVANPVGYDASGTPVSADVWTATRSDGSTAGSHCKRWGLTAPGQKGGVGASDAAGEDWIDRGAAFACNASAALYCIEIP